MNKSYRHFLCIALGFLSIFIVPSYASSFDTIGMNLYQDIYEGKIESESLFQSQATSGTRERFDSYANEWKQRVCPTCSTILWRDIDSSDLQTLQKSEFSTSLIVGKYLSDEAKESPLANEELRKLAQHLSDFSWSIEQEVGEQQDAYGNQKFLGFYYDGDEDNSGFDLMSDMNNIHNFFYDDVEKTTKKQDTIGDEWSLIIETKDRWSELSYGSSEFGDELQNDIINLLGWDEDSGFDSILGWASLENQCGSDEIFCIDIEFLTSSHDALGWGSVNVFSVDNNDYSNSFNGIYSQALAYLTPLSWENLAPKEMTKNFMEFSFWRDFNFSDMLSGGINVVTSPPPFLDGYTGFWEVLYTFPDSDKAEALESPKSTTKQVPLTNKTLDVLNSSFEVYWFGSYKERNVLVSQETYEDKALFFEHCGDNSAIDCYDKIIEGGQYTTQDEEVGTDDDTTTKSLTGTSQGEVEKKTFAHMSRLFDELSAQLQSMHKNNLDVCEVLVSIAEKNDAFSGGWAIRGLSCNKFNI